jgi:hypothetical protein
MIYGRVYNKAAESKEPRWSNSVRHELEIKGELCYHVMDHLNRQRVPRDTIAARLQGFFEGRGVPLPIANGPFTPMVVHRPTSDHYRQLEWLRVQCGPTVRRLVRAGMDHLVTEALGLHPSSTLELDQVNDTRNAA